MSIRALYRLIVGGGGVSPAYFFEHMTYPEMAEYIEGYEYRRREAWEQTRSVVLGIFQSQAKRVIDPREVMSFTWDEPMQTEDDDSEEARAALIARAKCIEEQLKNEYQNG